MLISCSFCCRVHEGQNSYQIRESSQLSRERILCIGSSRKRPVIKWENNMALPGKLTLTDKALYFEAFGLLGQKGAKRLDLARDGLRVKKTKLDLWVLIFLTQLSISSGIESGTWVLEFVSEVIASHKFICDYGPRDSDQLIFQLYGAHKGKERAIMSAINSIARLQALQFMCKLLDDPIKLVPFSYLQHAPYGDIVCQTLAVYYWAGPLVTKFTEAGEKPAQGTKPLDETYESSNHVFDNDGSVYLRKWMMSPSWASSVSTSFWKNSSVRQGVILSKNLVVAGLTLVERATLICKEKSQTVEKTQATVDAAMIKGIPINIDLFKELRLHGD
ncbi:hypothetical protein Patl1_36868 [Pistacia atlantica]|nr:hypothetical protein Patl1_36868 [Pistacia atlantica]